MLAKYLVAYTSKQSAGDHKTAVYRRAVSAAKTAVELLADDEFTQTVHGTALHGLASTLASAEKDQARVCVRARAHPIGRRKRAHAPRWPGRVRSARAQGLVEESIRAFQLAMKVINEPDDIPGDILKGVRPPRGSLAETHWLGPYGSDTHTPRPLRAKHARIGGVGARQAGDAHILYSTLLDDDSAVLDEYETGVRFLQRAYERDPRTWRASAGSISRGRTDARAPAWVSAVVFPENTDLYALLVQMGRADHLAADGSAGAAADDGGADAAAAHDSDS